MGRRGANAMGATVHCRDGGALTLTLSEGVQFDIFALGAG